MVDQLTRFYPVTMDPVQDPDGHNPEWTHSRKTPSQMARSRMETIPNGNHPEWKPPRMETITICCLNVSYRYCLVRSLLQRRGSKKN